MTERKEKPSPAFQWYAADFLADFNIAAMTAEEVGAYTLLLSYCWREGSLTDDLEHLAFLSRLQVPQFKRAWDRRIKRSFVQREDGSWVSPKLEEEREKQQDFRRRMSEQGKRGAEKRWPGDSQAIAKPQNRNGQATSGPMAKDSSSLSSSISSSSSTTNTSLSSLSPPNGKAAPPGERGNKSRFKSADRERYAEAKGMGDGWLINSQDGRYDEAIGKFMAKAEPQATGPQRTAQPPADHDPGPDIDSIAEGVRALMEAQNRDPDEIIGSMTLLSDDDRKRVRQLINKPDEKGKL